MGEFIHTHDVRDTVFDVDAERLARVYAEAVLGAAGGQAEQTALVEEFDRLRRDVLERNPKVKELFGSVLVSEDEKLALLDRVFGGRVSPLLLNVLKVLARHRRLGMVQDVIAQAKMLWEQRTGRERVELVTANPLSPELENELLASLANALDADPIVFASVNPDLIAGFVIRVGDRVFDGSMRTRLEAMRKGMIARATEAIQTNPQRFFATNA
jgi:F-type H+-transporting ATPase subunit delta